MATVYASKIAIAGYDQAKLRDVSFRSGMTNKCAAAAMLALFCVGTTAEPSNWLSALNTERARGCGGGAGVSEPLRLNRRLNESARRLSQGGKMREALEESGYVALKSTSIRMSAAQDPAAMARLMRTRFCKSLLDAELTQIGSYRSGQETWLVLARPFPAELRDSAEVSEQTLHLINAARAQPRRCGRKRYEAAAPLRLSPLLHKAALAHAKDMARNGFFDHKGSDGSTPAQRIAREGYRWRAVGENLAASMTRPQEAVEGWLQSPAHCANLMDPRFSETGIALSVNLASELRTYWTQVFAAPL